MSHPSGSGFDVGHVCLTCGNDQPLCMSGHDVRRCHVLDIRGMWREHRDRLDMLARARAIEDRKLGEREAA